MHLKMLKLSQYLLKHPLLSLDYGHPLTLLSCAESTHYLVRGKLHLGFISSLNYLKKEMSPRISVYMFVIFLSYYQMYIIWNRLIEENLENAGGRYEKLISHIKIYYLVITTVNISIHFLLIFLQVYFFIHTDSFLF